MSGDQPAGEQPARARVPADVDAPDKVIYGLTFRQLAILAVAATLLYTGWQATDWLLPAPVLAGGVVLAGGLVFGVAVGRRDGLPLDVWLLAALRYRQAPRALSTTDTTAGTPPWVTTPKGGGLPLPAPLRLPAEAIAADGEITLPGAVSGVAVVAATTVNLALRTPAEQAALVEAFGRWLNSLTTPTQIVVAATPVDLAAQARTLAGAARQLPHPALEAACAEHGRFLTELAETRDPLHRQVLLVTCAPAGHPAGGHAARRRAEDAARALAGLGVATRVLDGPTVTAVLAAAADPYRPPRPGGMAAPDAVITAATQPEPTSGRTGTEPTR